MKILFFTASVNIGGIERVFLSYATGLISYGHSVYFISCRDDGAMGLSIPENIKLYSLGNIRLRYSVWRLRSIIKNIKPEVIITGNDSTLVAYLAKILCFYKNVKLVTSQHSYYNNNETLFYTKPILKYIFPRCSKVIAVSTGIADMLSTEFGMTSPHVRVINNPVDINKIDTDALDTIESSILPSKFFVFLGRMTSVKNLEFLIDSFEAFCKMNIDYSLVMIGDGYERDRLERYVSIKGLNDKIIFIGSQHNPFPYLKKSKLLLLTSFSEAYPTVLIEAMRLGVTCVCTPTLGAIDILENGRYGYITKSFNDVNEFAQMMVYAIFNMKDPVLLSQHVERKYSLDSKVNELLNFINS